MNKLFELRIGGEQNSIYTVADQAADPMLYVRILINVCMSFNAQQIFDDTTNLAEFVTHHF